MEARPDEFEAIGEKTASRVGARSWVHGMSEFTADANEKESLATLDRALELGINFWDTADVYGYGDNEVLVGKSLRGRRERVFLATKFGMVRDKANPSARGVNGRPSTSRAACDASFEKARRGDD